MKRAISLVLVLLFVLTSCNLKLKPKETEEEPIPAPIDDKVVEDESEPEEEKEERSDLLKLVVPEGFTLARIGMRLEEMEVCTAKEFIAASQEGDFSEFSLIAEQQPNENRCFVLEGYLFPDTYEIYYNETPDSIIRKMLTNNERKYTLEIRKAIEETGLTVDEIITLASIIEKEAYERSDRPVPEEMPKISSILYNRMNDDMMLQCNVTATYSRWVLGEFVENGFDRYNDYYNTYHTKGLPAGAICNPGIDAINAAIYPADTKYLFFLTDKDKNFYYSETYEEHQVLVDKYLSDEK